MKTFKTTFFFVLALLAADGAQAVCDQTLSTGTNLATALTNAPAGSTLCLNAGNYGSINLDGINKASHVFIESTSGRTATLSLDIKRSSNLTFRNLTIRGADLSFQAKNISILSNTITDQVVINMGSNGGSYGNANILIDGNTFDGITVCTDCYEGRLQVLSDLPCGVTVSNNHFGNGGGSDGIQVGANGLKIGPGNVFDGIVQANYSRHIDAIQLYGQSNTTITGNYFINNDVQIMAPDGGSGESITHNVFIGNNSYRPAIQFGSHANDVFVHNTVFNIDVGFTRKKENNQNSTNALVRDNVFVNSSISTSISDTPGSGCSNCTFDHNLFSGGGEAGTNNVIGVPTFLGGANPASWAGYQLASTSLGYRLALDGQDMGTNVYGSGPITPPPPVFAAPTNLRSISVDFNQIEIQWDYVGTEQTGFSVLRKNGSGGTYSQSGTTTSLSFVDIAVSPLSTYCYQVNAYNDTNTSANSNELCVTTPQDPSIPNVAPNVSITSPASGASFTAGTNVIINASATDSDGTVSKVEFFNGATKLGEDLMAPYSLTMTAATAGSYSLVARATDNSDATTDSSAVSFTVVEPPPVVGQSLFTSQTPQLTNVNDGVSYELGMKFTATSTGKIAGIRFWKSSAETGTHTGKIYSSTGALLASVVFTSETASGWQQANLASPLSIAANTQYTVSVDTGAGYYVATNSGLASQVTNGNLKSVVGSNGVFGPVGSRPTNSWQNSNYFRDVVFVPDAAPVDSAAPTTSITSPANGSLVTKNKSVTIQAQASDDIGVTKVEFYVNGTLKCTDTSTPYSCNWTVPNTVGQIYQLQVKASDASGKVGSSAIVSVTSK